MKSLFLSLQECSGKWFRGKVVLLKKGGDTKAKFLPSHYSHPALLKDVGVNPNVFCNR